MVRSALLFAALLPLIMPLVTCARVEPPSGGPPDLVPPFVVETSPEAFAILEGFDGSVEIRFNERISENPESGTMEQAVVVSPETSSVRVETERRGLSISLEDGFEPGQVYRIRVVPTVQDMFTNTMTDPFELVFSTGPEFSDGVLAGIVLDRTSGDPVVDARIHARAADDSLAAPYVSTSGEGGIFSIRYLPPTVYRVTAFDDRNRNGVPDGSEAVGRSDREIALSADTTLFALTVLPQDTTPPRVVSAEAVDSVNIRIETDDYLEPTVMPDTARAFVSAVESEDTIGVAFMRHWRSWEESRRGADDPDTVTAGVVTNELLDEEMVLPRREIYAVLVAPMEPDVEYEVSVVGIVNIAGTDNGFGQATLVWERPALPESDAAADSTAVPDAAPDSTAAPAPDSTTAPAPDAPLDGAPPPSPDDPPPADSVDTAFRLDPSFRHF